MKTILEQVFPLPLQVRSLSWPYGNCSEERVPSVADCQVLCRNVYLVDQCGCHDVYMKPQRNKSGGEVPETCRDRF